MSVWQVICFTLMVLKLFSHGWDGVHRCVRVILQTWVAKCEEVEVLKWSIRLRCSWNHRERTAGARSRTKTVVATQANIEDLKPEQEECVHLFKGKHIVFCLPAGVWEKANTSARTVSGNVRKYSNPIVVDVNWLKAGSSDFKMNGRIKGCNYWKQSPMRCCHTLLTKWTWLYQATLTQPPFPKTIPCRLNVYMTGDFVCFTVVFF